MIGRRGDGRLAPVRFRLALLLAATALSCTWPKREPWELAPLPPGGVESTRLDTAPPLHVDRIRFHSAEVGEPRFFLALVPEGVERVEDVLVFNHGWWDRPEDLLRELKIDAVYGRLLAARKVRPAIIVLPDIRFSNSMGKPPALPVESERLCRPGVSRQLVDDAATNDKRITSYRGDGETGARGAAAVSCRRPGATDKNRATRWSRWPPPGAFIKPPALPVAVDYFRRNSEAFPFNQSLELITSEISGLVSQRYGVAPARDHWSIGGFSFGGYVALDVARRYSGRFGSASVLSSFYDRDWTFWPAEPPPPGKLDGRGRGRQTIVAPGPAPRLMLACGTEDRLYASMVELHELLAARGIAHEWRTAPGGHTWAYWSSVLEPMLLFHLGIDQPRATDRS